MQTVNLCSCGLQSKRTTLELSLTGEVIVKPLGSEVERGGSEQQEERLERKERASSRRLECYLCLVLSVFGFNSYNVLHLWSLWIWWGFVAHFGFYWHKGISGHSFFPTIPGIDPDCVSLRVTESHNLFLFIVHCVCVVHANLRVKWQSRESGRTPSVSTYLLCAHDTKKEKIDPTVKNN